MTFAEALIRAQSRYDSEIPEDDRTDAEIEQDASDRIAEKLLDDQRKSAIERSKQDAPVWDEFRRREISRKSQNAMILNQRQIGVI